MTLLTFLDVHTIPFRPLLYLNIAKYPVREDHVLQRGTAYGTTGHIRNDGPSAICIASTVGSLCASCGYSQHPLRSLQQSVPATGTVDTVNLSHKISIFASEAKIVNYSSIQKDKDTIISAPIS